MSFPVIEEKNNLFFIDCHLKFGAKVENFNSKYTKNNSIPLLVDFIKLDPTSQWDITGTSSNMKKSLFILSALVLVAFCSCNKYAGDPVSKDFSIEGSYTKLDVDDAFNVTVSDEVNLITITAGENVMPNVVVEIVDNTLKIHLKPFTSNYGSDMKAVVPYNANLTNVNLSGACEFHSEYGLEGENVEVELSGASDFYCDIFADEVEVHLSGASNFHGNIEADEAKVNLSGSSDFVGDLIANKIEAELSGSSNIKGNVSATDLDLDMTGASDATLEGRVATLKIDLSGASNIIRRVVGNQYALSCDRCEGLMSGSSDAYIHCDGIIKVDLSGASDLHFTGAAFTGDSTVSGGSNIIHDVL